MHATSLDALQLTIFSAWARAVGCQLLCLEACCVQASLPQYALPGKRLLSSTSAVTSRHDMAHVTSINGHASDPPPFPVSHYLQTSAADHGIYTVRGTAGADTHALRRSA